ncbi:hypothetical protein [Streptomyces sp. NPDC001903]|uniref:hypothetical protein n=1 Tax=Streptomyces sp. NPDC001903 TaxID=3364622 RepID=UPI00369121AD
MTGSEVTVVLGDCAEADALTVLAVLGEAFPSAQTQETGAGGAAHTVWTSVFDTDVRAAEPYAGAAAGPVRLGRPVTVEAQGGYVAVDRLLARLGADFAIDGQGTAAGDQEKDVHLTLRSRAA